MRKIRKLPMLILSTALILNTIPQFSLRINAEENNSEITSELEQDTEDITEEDDTEEVTEENNEDIENTDVTEEENLEDETTEEELEELDASELLLGSPLNLDLEEDLGEVIEEEELLGSPASDTNTITFSSQEEWDNFLSLNDESWQNGANSVQYKGTESDIYFVFTDSINIGTTTFTNANDVSATAFHLSTNEGNITATLNISNSTQSVIDINGASFVDSTINITASEDFSINSASFNNTTVTVSSQADNLTGIINNCSITNGSELISNGSPMYWTLTSDNIANSSILEACNILNLTINSGSYSNVTNSFIISNSSEANNVIISGASFTDTDILFNNSQGPSFVTVSDCTFNNSHFSYAVAPLTATITNTTFDGNTKSIISCTSSGLIPYYLTLTNVTGTNCHYDFIHSERMAGHIKSINGLNISTSDTGLSGIFSQYGQFAIVDFKDSTINGFDYAINLNTSSPCVDLTACVIWDNVDMLNCGVCGFKSDSATSYPFNLKDCTITGKNGAETGVYFKSTGATGGSSWACLDLFAEDLDGLTCIDGCDISNFETGLKGQNAPALAIDCYIHNVNTGIRGISTTGGTSAFRCILEAKENPDEESYGIAQISSSGCELCDCDISGFYVGACNIKPNGVGGGGSVEAYGCNFIDNIKAGLCGYCSTAVNCLFTGSTEIMFIGRSAPNSILDCTFVGNGTNIGAEDYDTYLYINTDSTARALNFAQYSTRNLSIGKTEFSNFKIGVNAPHSGGIQGGNAYVHDCNTGVSLTCDGMFQTVGKDWHIKDCDKGVVFRQFFNTSPSFLIEACNIGIQDDYDSDNNTGYNSWATSDGALTCKNCDIGLLLHKGFATNSNMTITLEGNRIGGILDSPRGDPSTGSITLKNNSETGIKYIGNNRTIHAGGTTFTVSGENQALYVDGIFNVFAPTLTATGYDDYYLASNGSYIDINSAYSLNGYKFLFDMPNAGYQEGRLVAVTVAPDYVDNFFTKKQGWIVVKTQQTNNSGEPIEKYNHTLTAGCLVTYDYATNGGSSVSGTVTGSEMYGSTDVTAYDSWKYKNGSAIDLSPEATKTGYEFVGWNTDKDATTGLTSLTAGTENITLYAIYKTTKTVTYHSYNANDNYTQNVIFYNNETEKTASLLDYTVAHNDLYSFVGYVLDENETDLTNNLLNKGDSFTVSDSVLDVYCVYDTDSILTYKDTDGTTTITTTTCTMRDISSNIISQTFKFILISKTPVAGFKFDGWLDSQGGLHEAGSQYIITDHQASLTASESEIMVESLSLSPKNNVIYIGETCELTATITPNTALDKTVKWESSKEDVATVNNGVVKGLTKGEVTITATNERSGKYDTATVIVKDAKSEKPKISLSSDCKVTITAGEVQDDELDKIYYRINGGEWQEYDGTFPVYKKFVVEAYQTTKIKKVTSEIVTLSGTEYASGITAKYIGDPKPIGTDVEKPEVVVTAHYPNSPDEEVTDFNLIDYTITDVGINIVTVTYNEYPNDSNSPTLTSTVEVEGFDPESRTVTIKGVLKYSDGTPIANKTISLDYKGKVVITKDGAVAGANSTLTTTDEKGYYVFKDILIGNYELSIIDDSKDVIAKCNITISLPKKDSVDITNKKDNVDVSYEITGNIINIDATITNPATVTPPPAKTTTPSPKTGDKFNSKGVAVVMVSSLALMILCVFLRKKIKK